jgi:protein pelota
MRVLSFDKKQRIAKLKATNYEDLWHLSKLIEPLDLLSAQSTRKVKLAGEEERARAVKKPIYITIEISRTEYSTNNLKCHGTNKSEIEGIPIGAAHAIDIQPGSEITIQKQKWHEYQIQRLKESEKTSAKPKALICILDDEEANLGLLTTAGIQEIGSIELGLAKKRLKEDTKKTRLKNLANELVELNKNYTPESIIVASPLFWKDELYKEIKETSLDLKKIKLEDIKSSGKRAFQELISTGSLKRLMKESRLEKETNLIEKLLAEIAKDSGLATYGVKYVEKAANLGAIETLLLTNKIINKFREKDQYDKIEQIIESTEQNKGLVFIIPKDNDPGKKLDGLTGIAAILRYKLE